MLNELYNNLREDKAFRDLFQPASKEEMEVRLRARLERSNYNYLFIADIEGEAGWGYEEDPGTTTLARDLMTVIDNSPGDLNIELEVEVFNTTMMIGDENDPGYVIGSFSGTVVVFSNDEEELEEENIIGMMTDYAYNSGGVLEITSVDLTNERVIRREDI